MSRPGDMIKSLPRLLWLLDREGFDAVFCTGCLDLGLPKRNLSLFSVLVELCLLLLLFLLFSGNRNHETGKKSSLVGSFLHLHQTSQLLLPVTHQKKSSEKKNTYLGTKHQLLSSQPRPHTRRPLSYRNCDRNSLSYSAACQFKISHGLQSSQLRHPISIQPVIIIILWSRYTAHSIARCLTVAPEHAYLALHSLFCRLKEKIGYHTPLLR